MRIGFKRLQPRYNYICNELEAAIKDKKSNKYLDTEKLKKQLKCLKYNSTHNRSMDMKMIITSLTLYKYLNDKAT